MQTTTTKAATLITGASGFIGRSLLSLLASQGIRCKALVRNPDAFVSSKISQSDIYEGRSGIRCETRACTTASIR